jgi:TRAP-type mannitol/chloroaromatic compound transport system permease small subunit
VTVPAANGTTGVGGENSESTRHKPAIVAFCERVDRLNEGVGWLLGPMIVFVAAAILYEVISRGAFNVATLWVSESSVYGSAAVYLLAGGYAMLHRRHVRIDLVLGSLSPRLAHALDVIVLPFLILYLGALIVVGADIAWTSFLQGEGTGSPWNPRIWPIKACIPLAGFLLLLQAFSNLFRDLGLAPARPAAPPLRGTATTVPPKA